MTKCEGLGPADRCDVCGGPLGREIWQGPRGFVHRECLPEGAAGAYGVVRGSLR